MSKKIILSTLLTSATLLGASSAHAATSDIKAESKKVTITADNAKLYKDSKMKESTVAKKGNVYIVDGYRDIDGKHVYRLYQENDKNEKVYKGYLVNKDAKDLTAEKSSGQYVAKKGATMWNDFYWNDKRSTTTEEKVMFAKYTYTLGNGNKYYSMYTKDKDGKDVWAGYTNASNVKVLKATEETKYVTLKKDYSTWSNLYFKQHKDDFKASKGVNFKVKRYYTLNGNKFYSTYRTDANGKEVWTGYVNGYASVVEDLKGEKVAEKDQKVQVVKDYNTYSNHFFNKKGQLSKNKIVTMKVTYTYGNGKKYASLYDGNQWLGYANIDAVTSASELLNNANKAMSDAKEKAQNATADSQKAIEAAIQSVEDAIKSNDATKINDSVNKLNEVVKSAQSVATKEELKKLDEAIKSAEQYVGTADTTTDKKALDQAIEAAKKVQEAAKQNNASSSEVDNAIKALEEAEKSIKPGETSINKEEVRKLQAAINLLEDIEKIGADKLTNDGNYETVLKGAQDTLKLAQAGKATQAQIDKAIKTIEDFINGLSLNNSELSKLVQEIKALGEKVYMTTAQEEKFNAFINDAEEAVKDTQLSNVDKLKEINKQAEAAKDFVSKQPTEKDVQELINVAKEKQTIESKTKGHAADVFDGWDTVETKAQTVDTMLDEIKKDKSSSDNTATTAYTAKEVQNTAGELVQAINRLTVNKENTTKFYNAAESAINELEGQNKTSAQDLLNKFKAQLESDHSMNNIEAIVSTAKALVVGIEKDQKQELDNVIAKAKRIEGSNQEYKKYYDDSTYNEMNTKLTEAEAADKKLDGQLPSTKTVPAEVTNGQAAEKAEKDLESAINNLKVKNWDSTTNDTQTELTKYNPLSLENKTRGIIYRNDKIEVPGLLKDKQTTLKDNMGSLIPATGQVDGNYVNSSKVTVDFVEQAGHKVQAPSNISGLFEGLGAINISGLDTSKTTNMKSLFSANYGTEITGLENLDVSKVTNLSAMFNNSEVTKLNFTNWKFEQSSVSLTGMFCSANKLTEVTLPNDENTAKKIAQELHNESKKNMLTTTVQVKYQDKVIGTLTKGQGFQSTSTSTITTDEATLKDASKLSRAILTSSKADTEAKELAKVVEAAYEVDENSTGNDAKSIAGLENNRAWTEFGGLGDASYYDAIKDLQNYARNTKSVTDATLKADKVNLVDDMEGLRVEPTALQSAMTSAEKLSSKDASTESLIREAKVIVESKTDSRRGLDNWKHINNLIAKLKAVVKK